MLGSADFIAEHLAAWKGAALLIVFIEIRHQVDRNADIDCQQLVITRERFDP